MKRNRTKTRSLRLHPDAAKYVGFMAIATDWSQNTVINKLLKLAAFTLDNDTASADPVAHDFYVAQKMHEVRAKAADEIAKIRKMKPRKSRPATRRQVTPPPVESAP